MEKEQRLLDDFKAVLKLRLPNITMDIESEEAMNSVYHEFARKICNTRIQEYISATKQEFAASKGLASTVETNLRATLLTNHTKLSTIREHD